MSKVIEKFRPLFEPRSIAFIGATANSQKWGFVILSELLNNGYRGGVYAVNPNERGSVLGLEVFPSVSELPELPDLAVIVTPQATVPNIISECVGKGIRASLVITAGFAEIGLEAGSRMEQEIVDIARRGRMILVGPNSNGIASPPSKLDLLMTRRLELVHQGPLAITSRSGSVGTTVAKRCVDQHIGFSRFVSNGNEADLHIEDYIEYFGEDEETKVILGYTEGIEDGRRFLDIAKRVAREKPIVMLMSGVTEAGARAARYHTASFYYGREPTYELAYQEAGIIRVNDIDELPNIGAAFLRQPLPKGRRVAILTLGGGWGVVASDACIEAGLEVVELPEETYRELDRFLPWWWSHNNPVDTATSIQWRGCLEALASCPRVDMLLLMWVAGKEVTPVEEVYPVMESLMEQYHKPIILCSGGYVNQNTIEELGKRQLISYSSVNQAVKALTSLADYAEYLSPLSGK
jgi:acetyltransferase